MAKSSKTKTNVWNIRGIEESTKNAVRLAAKKSRMTMGEWVNNRLYAIASEEVKHTESSSKDIAPRTEELLAQMMDMMTQQNARMEKLEQHAEEKPKGLWQRMLNK